MEMQYKMLEHPFYKAWSEGKITIEQLSVYAQSYEEFIKLIPKYWQKVIDYFHVTDVTYAKIVEEEYWHISLWKKWMKELPKAEKVPSMTNLIKGLDSLTPSQLLGAIHAFETQQPQISKVKKDCLIHFYGFEEGTLQYFDEHMQEDEHIAFGKALSLVYAHDDEFKLGIEKGSKLLYESLDVFMNTN